MAILETTEDRLLSTRQAAEASGFPQPHFNAQITSGKLPATKDEKGRWQIKQSDLDKYMKTASVKPRRSKAFIEAEAGKPESSLLTQLDEKKKQYEMLQDEFNALKRITDEHENGHRQEIAKIEKQVVELEKTKGIQAHKILSLEEENKDLRDQIYEHNQFLRESWQDFIHAFVGSDRKKS